MHDIVVVTTPGAAKRAFVNRLHRASGGRVSLAIIQKERPKPLLARLRSGLRRVPPRALVSEAWHALRFGREDRATVELFKTCTLSPADRGECLAPVLETHSMDDEAVQEALERLKPKVLVIWGGSIVKPRVLALAETAVNMHAGLCPHYRGANGNQHAVLNGERERIAITIHRAVAEVDSGEIYDVVRVNPGMKPPDVFRDLNDRAIAAYQGVAIGLLNDVPLRSDPQPSGGRTYRNKDFTFAKRRRLARALRDWMRE